MPESNNNIINQQTLLRDVSCTGLGLHSGEKVKMILRPSEENTGIRFIRTDIIGFDPEIAADYRNVSDTNLGTTISNDEGTLVSTIEHLMAALWGCGIDNALVELNGPEVPIMDGSAEPFVFLLECAGFKKQAAPRKNFEILKTVAVIDGNRHISLSPADSFSISLDIDFESKAISKQHGFFSSQKTSFKTDLCRARTFGFEHEVSKLHRLGLARGGSLDNAVVVSGNKILNKGGLRYIDEFVRHKILDCIGDFYLTGAHIRGSFKGTRSGHSLNNKLLHKLFSDPTAWKIVYS